MESYYSDLADRFFDRDTDWKALAAAAQYQPRATFRINGEFGRGTPTLAHNFTLDLISLYGTKVEPVALEPGCINLRLWFLETSDYIGRPFTKSIEQDLDYHRLFAEYGVNQVFLVRFPERFPAWRVPIKADGRPSL